jgi:osmoprotectant transport system permease protein
MDFLVAVIAWLLDPAHWQGGDGIPLRLLEHIQLSAVALAVAAAVALPVGLAVGHSRRGAFVALNLANVGRALPSLAILGLALPFTIQVFHQLDFWPTLIALVALAIPPMLTNASIGIREVDPEAVEVARGLGMSSSQVLARVELPIALPVVLGGIRTAAVQVVATATLGAFVAGGGLGRYIIDGIAVQETERTFVGAVLVALLALATEAVFGWLERRAVSPGLRPSLEAMTPLGAAAGATSR